MQNEKVIQPTNDLKTDSDFRQITRVHTLAVDRDSSPKAEATRLVALAVSRLVGDTFGVAAGYNVPSRDAPAVKRRPHVAMGFSPWLGATQHRSIGTRF